MKAIVPVFLLLVGLAGSAAAVDTAERPDVYRAPDRLAKLIADQSPPYLLVDVRTPEEYASGHIPTAVNDPVTEIGTRPPTTVKAALIIVYCRSGARSAMARETLVAMGYTSVVDFGSVSRWTGQLVKGDQPTGAAQPTP
jgi:phage shock protein E